MRRSREFCFAAGAAEQHLFAIAREPVRRIWLDDHAADGVAQFSVLVVLSVVVVGVGIHDVLASVLALLISLAPEPAPSHNGKVNTKNSDSIP